MNRGVFGLRLQILVALFVAVVLSFALLDFVAVELASRAREHARLRDAQSTAELFGRAAQGASPEAFEALADALVGRAGVLGVEHRPDSPSARVRGLTGRGVPVTSLDPRGEVVRLWIDPRDPTFRVRHAEVLFLYVALTGGGILVLAYVALTVLIVRPMDVLTRASERMARGHLDTTVPESGAAEVAALAASFNSMSAQLKADRAALEAKVHELTRTTAELASAEVHLVRSEQLASVGRLSAGLAHEIGNPLAAVLGLLELLRAGDLSPDESAEFLARIESETQRINRIIRDLLDFARQGKEDDGAIGSADAKKAVLDALGLVAPGHGPKGVTLERALDDVPRVRGSEPRIVQLALNLLLNATDAVAGKGHVRVGLAERGGAVELVVEDDGPGIAPEIADHLFEPFATTKPAGQGTGLGLAVCHTIATRSGGTITVTNKTTGGARFVVRLAVAAPSSGVES